VYTGWCDRREPRDLPGVRIRLCAYIRAHCCTWRPPAPTPAQSHEGLGKACCVFVSPPGPGLYSRFAGVCWVLGDWIACIRA
jgi:hypothetical protein